MRQKARVTALVLVAFWPAALGRSQTGPQGGTQGGTQPAPALGCAGAAIPGLARPRLPHLEAALRPGGRLEVLALGSATLLGSHGGMAGSVPDRMAQALRAAVPGMAVPVTLHATPAASAAEMLAILRRELAGGRFQLVLWQTGTVEALRSEPPERFQRTLEDGAAAAAAGGADLVLMDMPYSRLLAGKADLDPYRSAMAAVAARPGVALFPRYALMRDWAAAGEIDLEESAKPARRRTADLLRICLGQALARMLVPATAP